MEQTIEQIENTIQHGHLNPSISMIILKEQQVKILIQRKKTKTKQN